MAVINNCNFVTNFAAAHQGGWGGGSTINGFGGAIYHDGASLQVADSSFVGNSVQNGYYAGSYAGDPVHYGEMGGGALYVSSGSVSLTRVSLMANHTELDFRNRCNGSSGGAVAVVGDALAATNCTFARNTVHGRDGYWVYVGQGNTFTNPPLSSFGGAVYADSWNTNALLVHCTLSENESRGGDQGAAPGYGGAIYGNALLKACMVTGNYAEAGPDLYGPTSLGGNVIGDANGLVSWVGDDIFAPAPPILNPLQTSIDGRWYYSLPPLSPARDVSGASTTEDQILHARPVGDFADPGAYEGEYLTPAILAKAEAIGLRFSRGL